MIFSSLVGNLIEKGKPYLKKQLHASFLCMFRNALITLAMNITGIGIICLKPFGQTAAYMTGACLFIIAFIWGIYRFIIMVRKNYYLPVAIIREKNLYGGIVKFIGKKWPLALLGMDVYGVLYKVGMFFSNNRTEMPQVQDVVEEYVHFIIWDVCIFLAVFMAYMVAVYFFLKPLLLRNFTDLTTWQIYLFPFVHIKNMVKEICQPAVPFAMGT